MTAPDRTTDALASALPGGIYYELETSVLTHDQVAAITAKRLAEAGYVLVHTAPDEATVERLARVVTGRDGHDWPLVHPHARSAYLEYVRLVIAALADTSAQARHTDGETGGA